MRNAEGERSVVWSRKQTPQIPAAPRLVAAQTANGCLGMTILLTASARCGATIGFLMDFVEIERALDERTLVSNRDVDVWLDELEAAARVELEPGAEPAIRRRAATRLRMLREYRALRSLARRYGWSASEDEWPARPETIGLRRDPEQTHSAPAPETADAATVLIERVRTAKPEPAADSFETAVIRKREPEPR